MPLHVSLTCPSFASPFSLFLLVASLAATHVGGQKTPPLLSDTTICNGLLGITDLTPYQTNIDLVPAYGTYDAPGPMFLPIFATSPLDKFNSSITTVLFAVHGSDGGAQHYFCMALWAARAQRLVPTSSVLVVAPWFGYVTLSETSWLGTKRGREMASSVKWSGLKWLTGAATDAGKYGPSEGFTTSFDVLDAVVANLRESGRFPSIKLITLAGFSAGAQMLQRWSLLSAAPLGQPRVRVVVGSPNTYAYLDELRPAAECRPDLETGPSWNCSKFLSSNARQVYDCPTYNNYKYGIGGGFETNPYLAKCAYQGSLLTAKIDFAYKDVHFFVGRYDACNCDFAKENVPRFCRPEMCGGSCCDSAPASTYTPILDTRCQALLQGTSRLQRGRNFVSYLAYILPGYTPHFTAFSGGHDCMPFFGSSGFQAIAWTVRKQTQAPAVTFPSLYFTQLSASVTDEDEEVLAKANETRAQQVCSVRM